MTGKDMLQGIQNLDAELIEESEFGTFGKGKAGGFGKKKLLLILAAALIMATMTAAASTPISSGTASWSCIASSLRGLAASVRTTARA